jgi:hypothetical protein
MTLRGGASAMDDLELIRRFYPEAALRDDGARARARERLRAAGVPTPIGRNRRVAALGAGVAAAAAAAAVALTLLIGPDGAVVAELHGLARVAAVRELAAGDRPVVYERIESRGIDAFGRLETGEEGRIIVRRVHERWRSPDGSILEIRRVVEVSYPSRADELLAEALGFEVRRSERLELEPGAVSFPDLTTLPLDPADLLARIRDGWTARTLRTDAELLDAIAELLARGDGAPELRAALFEAAARLDGVELLGTVTDPLGREGVGFAAGSGQGRVVLVVDPRSTFLLSIEEHAGGEVTWRAYTHLATVQASGERPALG